MTATSSYTKYLPSVLWSRDRDPQQFLARTLRVYEKILTGILDDHIIAHDDHQHDPLEKTIDELAHLFNPWRTRSDFLRWLASWVALRLREDWSEYQQRRLISKMVSIYQQRGLKEGLNTFLDIYAINQAKPRIAIDDGEAILRVKLLEEGTARLHAVAYSHTVAVPATSGQAARTVAVMLHPVAIGVDIQNNYIVADEGGSEEVGGVKMKWDPALWKVSCSGEVDYRSDTPIPLPRPIHTGDPLEIPTAVVVDSQNRIAVLDIGSFSGSADKRAGIYRFTPPDYDMATVVKRNTFGAVHPVDMVLDDSERFVVLDRGLHLLGFPPAGDSQTKIVVVTDDPVTVEEHDLRDVITEPTALVMDSAGRYIVGDAKDQFQTEPADLVSVDPAQDWKATSLLEHVDPNPLIYPTGLAFESEQSLLVVDVGVRRGFKSDEGDQSERTMAETATLYRVDLAQTPPVITRITQERKLVSPTKLIMDRKGKLIVSDRGGPLEEGSKLKREWRARPNEFGVVVHFSQQRPTESKDRNQIRRGIAGVVEEHRPANTSWWMDF